MSKLKTGKYKLKEDWCFMSIEGDFDLKAGDVVEVVSFSIKGIKLSFNGVKCDDLWSDDVMELLG